MLKVIIWAKVIFCKQFRDNNKKRQGIKLFLAI